MRILIFFLFCLFHITATAQRYWQQEVNYIIDVSLNEKNKTLDGFEKITYINHSPDTLHYIWFHIWPNAYKNDRTAFSDQRLENNNTRFYFSDKEQKGYINRLDFKVNGNAAKTEDHPQHIDIIKVILPTPLPPGTQAVITTPFHVKLPYNFSRGGYDQQALQVTQWYPKPAVYDAQGWHPMPYLDQGEFYSEFGNYDVRITVPQSFVVAATGVLQNDEEKEWLKTRKEYKAPVVTQSSNNKTTAAKKPAPVVPAPTTPQPTKTLRYLQNQVHDFAWFANKGFIVKTDTCQLSSGKIIDVEVFYTSFQKAHWEQALNYTKDAVRFYSTEVGEYPYQVVRVVQGPKNYGGGMEYPTITVIAPTPSAQTLDVIVAHEVGHNWFYGIVASNERAHPWMDEGLNSFYEKKYTKAKYGVQPQWDKIGFQTMAHFKKDQPINTPAEAFSPINYALVAYHKTAKWLEGIEEKIGEERMREAMQAYYTKWKFRHPQPEDFKSSLAPYLQADSSQVFSLLSEKGLMPNQVLKGNSFVTTLFPKSINNYLLHPTKNAIIFSPIAGFNNYDKLMIGGLLTNYKLPPSKFQFLAIPLYATGSKQLRGLGKLNYSIITDSKVDRIDLGLAGSWFSKNRSLDSNEKKLFESFEKITPYARFNFRQAPRSSKEQWIEARSFLIREKDFSHYVLKSADSLFYVDSMATSSRYVNQLTFGSANHRKLYPYDYQLQMQQGERFYRVNFTGNYFFNYADGGGASVRLFAAKFGYFKKDDPRNFSSHVYQPKLLGVTGEEDYTYSNYFLGRTASSANDASIDKNSGLAAQQIMIRDGGFKLRIDQYEFLQGRSENWVAALNLNTTLPEGLFPVKIPLRLFLDIGSFSEAWQDEATTSKFLYVGGLQLALVKDLINIYVPLIYSNDFKENLKALPEQNKLSKKITFSIDLHRLNAQKILANSFSF